MNADSAIAAKVWMWDGKMHELNGVSGRPVQTGRSTAAVGIHDAVIVASSGSPRFGGEVWQLLAPRASGALQDSADIYRRWKRAGLLRTSSEADWNRTLHDKVDDAIRDGWRVYVVSLFHLEPVALRRIRRLDLSEHGRNHAVGVVAAREQRETTEDNELYGSQLHSMITADSLLRRVVRMANRAVYSLGLDIGDAVIALHGSGRTAALSVEQPDHGDSRGRDGGSAMWKEAFSRFQQWYCAEQSNRMNNQDRSLLIGADPEFVLLRDNGRIVPADRYFGVGGGAGADALLVGRRIQYPIGEVRPDPAATPDGLAASVRRQLMRAASRVSDDSLRWAAGAMPVAGVALGGHIHVSGAALTSRLLRQLDRYVAMPVAMIESDNGRGRRPRYGALGDYRLQPHGGFEYRTLPSWLASPAAAKAAFALTLLCAKDTWSLPVRPLLLEREEAAFYEGDRSELLGSLDAIAGELAVMPSYREYARWIEPLFEAARRGAVWDESVDIRRKWRVGPFVPT